MVNSEQLQEIEQRWAKATPGPWATDSCQTIVKTWHQKPGICEWKIAGIAFNQRNGGYFSNKNDAAAIANAPTDIALLIAEVQRLNHVVDKACASIDGCPRFNTMDSSGNGNWFCGEKDCMRSKGPYTDCWRKYLQEGEAD